MATHPPRSGEDDRDAALALLVVELNRRKSELTVMIADDVRQRGRAAVSSPLPELERKKAELTALAARVQDARTTRDRALREANLDTARAAVGGAQKCSQLVDNALLLREIEVALRELGDAGVLETKDAFEVAKGILERGGE